MAQELFPDFQVILVPGLHDSGAGHWQTRWQRAHPEFWRVRQDDWSDPDLPAWAARVDQVRARDPRPALLVAHSFGCLAAVHSIAANPRGVAGAFLVAPADPDKFGVAGHAAGDAARLPDLAGQQPQRSVDARRPGRRCGRAAGAASWSTPARSATSMPSRAWATGRIGLAMVAIII